MLRLDHLVVTCGALDAGVAAVEAALGVALEPAVGRHPRMGTMNRLLSLGDGAYLEVIAPDPDAPRPPGPRWFRMDERDGTPRLTNWVAAADDLDAALAAAPPGAGLAERLERGPYRWRIAIPPDGRWPMDDIFPGLIGWEGDAHPARALPDRGLRLRRLVLSHPDGDTLRAWLAPRLDDPRITVAGGAPGLSAVLATPQGDRVLPG